MIVLGLDGWSCWEFEWGEALALSRANCASLSTMNRVPITEGPVCLQ